MPSLHSTEKLCGRRVPRARAEIPGLARVTVAGAAAVTGASGSAAHAGRPREQAPPDAALWAGNPPRAPPAESLSRTGPPGQEMMLGRCEDRPSHQRPLQSANDPDATMLATPWPHVTMANRPLTARAGRPASHIAGSAPMIRACPVTASVHRIPHEEQACPHSS